MYYEQLPDAHNKEFNRMLNSHLKQPHMLLRGQRVVIQCSTDTYLKPLIGRRVSFMPSDMAEVYGMCVHECLGVSL